MSRETKGSRGKLGKMLRQIRSQTPENIVKLTRRRCLTRSPCSSRPYGVAALSGHRPPLIAPGGDEDGVTDCPNCPRDCEKCGLGN